MKSEELKPITGWDYPYTINGFGQIWNGTKYLTHYKNIQGKKYVLLVKDGKPKARLVHRLMADAFLTTNPGQDALYFIDGNPNNLDINNIDWIPLAKGSTSNSRRSRPFLQFTMDGQLLAEWTSIYGLCKLSKWAQPNITAALKGKRESAYGFKWKYKE